MSLKRCKHTVFTTKQKTILRDMKNPVSSDQTSNGI